jgi:hypothetical protein
MKKILFLFALVISITSQVAQAQAPLLKVGEKPTTLDKSAVLEVQSTNKGFLPPRMTTSERDEIANPAIGLLIYNTTNKSVEWFDGTSWYALRGFVDNVSNPTSYPLNYVGTKAIVRDVVSPTGQVWMDRNLGSSKLAGSSSDTDAYGDYFQWGRFGDGHQIATSTTVATQSTSTSPGQSFITQSGTTANWLSTSNTSLWQGSSGLNNPCPVGYKVPTFNEIKAEFDLFTTKNVVGAFESVLKIAPSGNRNADGSLGNQGVFPIFWTSTIGASGRPTRIYVGVNTTTVQSDDLFGATFGFSVRCIKEVYPASYTAGTKSKVEEVTGAAGKIWMDRNLGASKVALSSTYTDAYGDYFQWGRAGDGHQVSNSTTTTTQSTGDTPANGSFITGASNGNWRSTANNNLWQGVNGINSPCPKGFRVPTLTELQNEFNLFPTANSNGALNSPLKLPLAGSRSNTGSLGALGSWVILWSSTIDATTGRPRRIYVGPSTAPGNDADYGAVWGFSVRCIKDL